MRLRFRGQDFRQPVHDCIRHHRHELEWTSLLWSPRRNRQGGANMKSADNRVVRCAIYTRVSTDSGLDQEFNSLDAQYDAASAYIRSQTHARWTLVRTRYDDGGFSGGSTERPALQCLLADVRARKVQIIVVYKVDRLTRSLADFAKVSSIVMRAGMVCGIFLLATSLSSTFRTLFVFSP